MDVAAFYRDFDKHPGDRVRLFGELAEFIHPKRVLYPGSYVDIAPSVHFDQVTYLDMDKRAARFFTQTSDVKAVVNQMRRRQGTGSDFDVEFIHGDYRETFDLPQFDLLVSLYAGFVSEHCSRYLRKGGHLLVNDSHGDASMAHLDNGFELTAVLKTANGGYRITADGLDEYFIPKKDAPTVDSLHTSRRGVVYSKRAFAYLFLRIA